MRIITLMENTSGREELKSEHGLSLYIETGRHKILFDAGQSGAFADNAEKLGVDLSAVDFAVLSHGHYDHGGGLARFLACNARAPVYVSSHAFGGHYNGEEKYIGLDTKLKNSGRMVYIEEVHQLAEGITLHPAQCLDGGIPVDSAGLTREEDGVLLPEDFRHEQYLLVEEDGKRICFSGCSHRGIVNIVSHFQPDVLVGGFHFMKRNPQGKTVSAAAQSLLDSPTRYYTGHCTGLAQYQWMKRLMGQRLEYLATGSVVEL